MDSVSNPPWSDLPQDLLSTISNLLSSDPIDGLAFRAVCKSWLISSSPVFPFTLDPVLPITVSRPRSSFDFRLFDEKHGLPIISTTVIFLCRHPEHVTESWVMFADQLTPGKLMIRRPLTKCYYSMPMGFPKSIDVPNVHGEEIGRFYNLNFHSEVNKPPSMWSEYVNKVVLNSDESFAIGLFQTGNLGLLNLRSILCGKWKRIYPSYDDGDARIDDIVNLKGKFLAVDVKGKLYNVNLSQCTMKVIAPSINDYGEKRMRLVESNGILYLVVTYGVDRGEKDMFKVFEFDDDLDRWVQVKSIDNMVFFIGLDFSFSISSQKLGGSFGKECIVYNTDSFDYHQGVYSDSDSDSGSGSGGGSAGKSESDSETGSGSENDAESDDECESGSRGGSEGGSKGGSESEHESEGLGEGESVTDSEGESDGEDEGEGEGEGESDGEDEGETEDESESESVSRGRSEGGSKGGSESEHESKGVGEGESDGEDEGEGESDGEDEGEDESEDESEGSIEVEGESGSHGGGIDIRIWHMTDTCHSGGGLDLLWPPPTWLWSIDMSKRIVDVEAALDDMLANAPAEKLEGMSTDLNRMLTLLESVNQLCKSINLQNNQVGTTSNAAGTPQHSETVISDEMKKLNGNILLVEELVTKMHHTLKSCHQPSRQIRSSFCQDSSAWEANDA